MKKFQRLSIMGAVLFLTACASKPPIMPSLKYEKPVDFHIDKSAYLHWEVGKQYSSKIHTHIPHDSGLLGVAIATTVDVIDRERNPSRYMLTYGKAEQAIFMTSLRDTLEQNQVFKGVELVTDLKGISEKNVLITLYFKTSRVSSAARNNRITLTVDMTITTKGKPPFKRTYLAQSDLDDKWKGFRDQQTEVSLQLLEKVISGIKKWHEEFNQGARK